MDHPRPHPPTIYPRIGSVEAAIEIVKGQRVEWSRSPEARNENRSLTLPSGRTLTPTEG